MTNISTTKETVLNVINSQDSKVMEQCVDQIHARQDKSWWKMEHVRNAVLIKQLFQIPRHVKNLPVEQEKKSWLMHLVRFVKITQL